MNRKSTFETTSMSLHVMAMLLMLCDHFKRVFPDVALLPSVGRIAFPIFAFLIVEGYHHTRDLKKYAKRLLLFALLSEIPFDLMVGGVAFYPSHQNVLWTFLMGLGLVHINEKAKKSGKIALRVLAAVGTVAVGYYAGMLTNVDYRQAGALTVLAFYFFRKRTWWCFALQLASLVYLNFAMLASYALEFSIFGYAVSFPRQGLAVLALIPIWLYRGKQGTYGKWLRPLYYGFYPGHMLVISVLAGTASPYVLLVFLVPVLGALVWRLIGEKGRTMVKTKLDEIEDPTFVKASMIAAVMLLLVAPFFYMPYLPVDTVTVFYIQDYYTRMNSPGGYTRVVSTKDRESIQEWIAFREEVAPEEKQTGFTAF